MNRKERRQQRAENRALLKGKGLKLEPIPVEDWPPFPYHQCPRQIFISRKYLVQVYMENRNHRAGDLIRLSTCRSNVKTDGNWDDRLSWDELMEIKRELGFGAWYGVEVYPRDCDIINIANFRHVWLMRQPLNIGWFGERAEQ